MGYGKFCYSLEHVQSTEVKNGTGNISFAEFVIPAESLNIW